MEGKRENEEKGRKILKTGRPGGGAKRRGEIEEQIRKLKKKKSAGKDSISNEV